MKKEKYFIHLICVIGSIIAQPLIDNDAKCTTPKKKIGLCVVLTKCQPLLNVVSQQNIDETAEEYITLKESHCGFEGKTAKVCCSLNDLSLESTETGGQVAETDRLTEIQNVTMKSNLVTSAKCGTVSVNRDRIIGGSQAQLGSWPWMAALGYHKYNKHGELRNDSLYWLCGGSLISEKHILTAAHCIEIAKFKLFTVRLGELNLDPDVDDGAMPIDIPVELHTTHWAYNTFDFSNDIALLTLSRKVTFTDFIQPICLLSLSDMNNLDLTKVMPYVVGWGSSVPDLFDENHYPHVTALMEVQVPLVNTTECKRVYNNNRNAIDERVICAGYPKGGKDSCRGDSGGPLMWSSKMYQYFLMGIVSYGGKKCGLPDSPGVYTSVPSFSHWIKEKIQAI